MSATTPAVAGTIRTTATARAQARFVRVTPQKARRVVDLIRGRRTEEAVAVLAFATLGAVGYVRARRGGLLRSRCRLGDTRLVIAYLVVVALAGAAGTAYALAGGHLGA